MLARAGGDIGARSFGIAISTKLAAMKTPTRNAPRAPLLKPAKGGLPVYLDPQSEREASRYDHPILSREGLLAFLGEQGELLNAERIAELLAYRDAYRQEALTKRLSAMVRDGQLLVNRRGGYGLATKLDLIAGTVIANPDGFGFLRPDAGGEDLFIPPYEMRAVMHGDRVLVNVTGHDRRGRQEAAIAEVLERRRPRLVGRFDERAGVGIVIPDDRRLHQDVLIPPGQQLAARPGQIVVAEVTEPPSREHPPIGKVVAVLGEKLSELDRSGGDGIPWLADRMGECGGAGSRADSACGQRQRAGWSRRYSAVAAGHHRWRGRTRF